LLIAVAAELILFLVLNIVDKKEVFIKENLLPVLITGGALTLLYLILSYLDKKEQLKEEN